MRIYHHIYETRLPIPLDQAWDFFTNPRNLAALTPRAMHFRFVDEPPEKIYPGLKLKMETKIWGIPMPVVNEIVEVIEKKKFTDHQIKGPFALWHHQHIFKEIKKGVEVYDGLEYALPFCVLGRLANQFYTANLIRSIFAFRQQSLEILFGKYSI